MPDVLSRPVRQALWLALPLEFAAFALFWLCPLPLTGEAPPETSWVRGTGWILEVLVHVPGLYAANAVQDWREPRPPSLPLEYALVFAGGYLELFVLVLLVLLTLRAPQRSQRQSSPLQNENR